MWDIKYKIKIILSKIFCEDTIIEDFFWKYVGCK